MSLRVEPGRTRGSTLRVAQGEVLPVSTMSAYKPGGKVFQGTHPCAASPDVIITRNTKHFEGLSIPVKEP